MHLILNFAPILTPWSSFFASLLASHLIRLWLDSRHLLEPFFALQSKANFSRCSYSGRDARNYRRKAPLQNLALPTFGFGDRQLKAEWRTAFMNPTRVCWFARALVRCMTGVEYYRPPKKRGNVRTEQLLPEVSLTGKR